MFDIPTTPASLRKQCARFRTGLKNEGFLMLQKSIYYKMIKNVSSVETERKSIKKIVPSAGCVQFLAMPLANFMKMNTLVGPEFDMARLTASILDFE